MSVESWNAFFQLGSLVLVLATFALGAGALWTGNRINEKQTARLVTLETELAQAKERAAKAEIELLDLKKRAQPRRLSTDQETLFLKLAAAITPKKGVVEVVWQSFDPESQSFGGQLHELLKKAGFSAKIAPYLQPGDIPVIVGVMLRIRDPKNPPSILQPLAKALRDAGVEFGREIQWNAAVDPDTVEIIIGPRQ